MVQKFVGIGLSLSILIAIVALFAITHPALSTIRDIVIIVWGGFGTLVLIVILLIVLAIYIKLGPIFEALYKSLGTMQGTLGTIQRSVILASDLVIRPVIRGTSLLVGIRQGLRATKRILKWKGKLY
jgi:hypothetical protein